MVSHPVMEIVKKNLKTRNVQFIPCFYIGRDDAVDPARYRIQVDEVVRMGKHFIYQESKSRTGAFIIAPFAETGIKEMNHKRFTTKVPPFPLFFRNGNDWC
ncbi:unnamed protein product, partial [Allacma fusca]